MGRKEGDLTPMPARMGEALLVRGEERGDLGKVIKMIIVMTKILTIFVISDR